MKLVTICPFPVFDHGSELLGFGDGSFRGEFRGLSTRVVHSSDGFEYSLVQFNTVWRTRARAYARGTGEMLLNF